MNENNSHIDNENLSFLDGISKKNNFKTPAGYFEGLASKLEKDLEVQNSKSPKRGVVRNMIINLSIAASVIVGVFIFKPSPKTPEVEMLLGVEVSVDDFMEGIIEEPYDDVNFIAEIDEEESLEREITVLLATQGVDMSKISSDELQDVFEEDWDEYEF